MLRLIVSGLICGLMTFGVPCSVSGSPQTAAPSGGDRLEGFIEAYVAFRLGENEDEPKPAEAWSRRAGELRAWLEKLESIPRDGLTLDQDIDYRLIASDLKTAIARIERERRWEKDPGLYLRIEGVDAALTAADDAPEAKRKRLDEAFKEMVRLLSLGRANLKNPPAFFLDRAVEKTKAAVDHFQRDVRKRVAGMIGGEDSPGEGWEQAAAALTEYARFLEVELRPRAGGSPGIGKELYDYYLRETYFLEEDTESILRKGEAYFAGTLRLLEETARAIDPQKTWPELIRENRRNHPGADGLLAAWEKEIERARRHVLERNLATIPGGESVLVMPTPPAQRDRSPFGIMETPLPFSSDRVGKLIINPVEPDLPADVREALLSGHDYTFIATIAPHETYPGHHLHALKIQENPRLMRKLSNSTLFTEGWGLYAEELMHETGFFPDRDRTRLTQLLSRLWRAARVILDVKLQTGRISYDGARRFLEENVMFDPARSAGEVNMYVASPTYFITYIIGYFDIMALRLEYAERMGGRFSLGGFHEAMLRTGALPVSLVREILLPAR